MCGKPVRRPELAAEVKYLTDRRQPASAGSVWASAQGQAVAEVRREVPTDKPDGVVGYSVVTRERRVMPDIGEKELLSE